MKLGFKYYIVLMVGLLLGVSPVCAAMQQMPEEQQESTLDQVSHLLTSEFDSKITEPWYKPARGFAAWHNISKAQAVESLGYGAAGVGAGLSGAALIASIYCAKTGDFTPLAKVFGSLGSFVGTSIKSWFVLGPACVGISSALFVKILRAIHRRSARGKCLLWRVELENEIRELRAITSNKFNFTSGAQAESCARGYNATSPWPLPDLVERFSQSKAVVIKINRNIEELEKAGIEGTGEVKEACKVLKSAGAILTQALLKNIEWLQSVKPTFAEQDKARSEYQKQVEDRIAITQAGGTLSYGTNTAYGNRQPAVVVNTAAA